MKNRIALLLLVSTIARAVIAPDVITVTNAASADALRDRLVAAIWGPEGWPTGKLPTFVGTNWNFRANSWSNFFTNCTSLARVDIFYYDIPFHTPTTGAIRCWSYRFVPVAPNGDLFILHAGHSSGVIADAWSTFMNPVYVNPLFRLLEAGYTVLGFSMPLFDGSSPPDVSTPAGPFAWGPAFGWHDALPNLDPYPMRFFFEQIPVLLDWCQAASAYHHIFMAGHSGGGWTTTWYAALDHRIKASFSIAGSVPAWLRIGFEGLGDWEQTGYPPPGPVNPIYDLVNYSELYTLATFRNRLHFQILNEFDDCCFWGTRHTNWVANVGWAAQQLSDGRYRFRLDSDLHTHWISPASMQAILDEAHDFSRRH